MEEIVVTKNNVVADSDQQRELDNLIDALAEKIAEDESGVSVGNSQRVQCVELVHEAMKRIVSGIGVEVLCEMNEPYASMGAVSVIGKEIVITDTKAFAMVARLADNVEVYPKVDGTTQINLIFHRLTRKVGN